MAKLVERLLIQKSRISICGGTRNAGSTLNIDLYVPFANEEHENFIVDFMFQNLWLPCLFIVILSLVMLIRNVGNLLHVNKFCHSIVRDALYRSSNYVSQINVF